MNNDPFIEHLKNIHYSFRAVLDVKDYDKAIEMMNSYNEESDVNELNTILIITQSFKEHEKLGEPYKRLSDIFDDRLAKIIKNEKE